MHGCHAGLVLFLLLVRQHWSHLADSSPGFVPETPLLSLILRSSPARTSHLPDRSDTHPSIPAPGLTEDVPQQSAEDLHRGAVLQVKACCCKGVGLATAVQGHCSDDIHNSSAHQSPSRHEAMQADVPPAHE